MLFASFRLNQRSTAEAHMTIKRPKRHTLRVMISVLLGLICGAYFIDRRPPLPVSVATIAPGEPRADCAARPSIGETGDPHEIVTNHGLRVVVRTPLNYLSDRPYPLVVVYPPAQFDRYASERFYNLTTEATRRGIIVAYSDHLLLSMRAVEFQAEVPASVAAHFCINVNKIAYFGHSDGGAIAEGIPGTILTAMRPRAIVASGAGITAEDLMRGRCASGVNVMIVHSRNDTRFPDFGRGAAAYWAQCAACRPLNLSGRVSACQKFEGCAHGTVVMYCDVDELHEKWPGVEGPALDFIESANNQIAVTSMRP